MQENNTYKYLSILLAIIAIVFAVLYFLNPTQPVSNTVDDIAIEIQACKDNIAKWQQSQAGQATTSLEAQEGLNDILENCKGVIETSQDSL